MKKRKYYDLEKIKTFSVSGYFEWLLDFMKDKSDFFDSDWDYTDEKLNASDQQNVNCLFLLFEVIFQYARENKISSSYRPLGEYFPLKVHDIGFEIGYITGQGTSFYCKKIPLEKDEQFIDYKDILKNEEKQETVKVLKKK